MIDDVMHGFVVPMVFGLIVIVFVGGTVALCVDAYQDRASFPAQAACQERRMRPLRQGLSANVVCVPVNTRQDTTTVNLNTKP